MKQRRKINCFACRYFYITWDNSFPYGCKAMGFKSAKLPMMAVFEASGRQCYAFSPKPKKAPTSRNTGK